MKVQCIDHQDAPQRTFLIKIRQHTILLNCALDTLALSSVSKRAPRQEPPPPPNASDLRSILSTFSEHNKLGADAASALGTNCDADMVFRTADFSLVDVNSIDVILVSNQSLMLGLPFLTEYLGYKGKIIATEPTVEFARQRMEELVLLHGPTTSRVEPSSSTHFSHVGSMYQHSHTEGWRSIYTLKDIASCMERIQPVRYTEKLSLFSTLDFVAYSAGYCLGSANWLLETGFKKIVFMSSSSGIPGLHPAPLDPMLYHGADVVLVSDLSSQSGDNVYERAKNKALAHAANALSNQLNVVFSISITDTLFDLIGSVVHYLRTIPLEVGAEPHQIPIYVVSPIAEKSLQYANICGEWMTSEHQEQLYVPSMPLIHGDLLKSEALKVIPGLNANHLESDSIRCPCIVFTSGQASGRRASMAWLAENWGGSSHNPALGVFIDVEPQPSIQPRVQGVWTPMDARLSLFDLPSLLYHHWEASKGCTVRHILIPRVEGATEFKERLDKPDQTRVHMYGPGEIVGIDLARDWEGVSISEKLAMTLNPTNLPNGNGSTMYAPISGLLAIQDNRLELHPMASIRDDQRLSLDQRRPLLNSVELSAVITRLHQNGIPRSALQVTMDANGCVVIELPPDMEASIRMDGQATTVNAKDEGTRVFLRDTIVTDT